MSTLIYVETSIPSFYFETRERTRFQAMREWTREWWEVAKVRDTLVTSEAVSEELERAPEPKRSSALGLIHPLRRLDNVREVDEMAAVYIAHKIMPADAKGDARHLALATFHGCAILATWNCQRPPALPLRAVLSHRLSRSARLQTHRQREQAGTHPACSCDDWHRHATAGDAL